jgi:hypothetical protein
MRKPVHTTKCHLTITSTLVLFDANLLMNAQEYSTWFSEILGQCLEATHQEVSTYSFWDYLSLRSYYNIDPSTFRRDFGSRFVELTVNSIPITQNLSMSHRNTLSSRKSLDSVLRHTSGGWTPTYFLAVCLTVLAGSRLGRFWPSSHTSCCSIVVYLVLVLYLEQRHTLILLGLFILLSSCN